MRSASTRAHSEAGTTVLMAATIILPLLFFLLSLSLDGSRYFVENLKIQKTLDEIATYSYRFLPFETEAKLAAEAYLNRYPDLAPNTQVAVDADTVSLRYAGMSPLTFPRFFGFHAGLPSTAVTKVRGTPLDSMVLLDTSAYLAPELSSSSAWGADSDWPPASFFSNEFQMSIGGSLLEPRIATQQCFNPAFSVLKRAAIQTFEYLSHFRFNAVGVAVYPGTGANVDVLREIVSPQVRSIGPGEANFSFYVDSHNRNELCAAAAEREQEHSAYRFGKANPRLELDIGPPGQPVNLTLPDPQQGSWYLNPDFLAYVRTRHALWSQSRRQSLVGDTAEVLREIRARLVGAAFQQEREGLANSALKSAFIFAGDVPHVSGKRFPEAAAAEALADQIDALKSDIAFSRGALFLRLYYVLFRYEGNEVDGFESRVSNLAAFFSDQQKIDGQDSENLRIQLVYADSGDSLERFGLGALALSAKTAVLSR